MSGREGFIQRYGAIYEDSPWVAEAVWPGAGVLRSAQALAGAMAAVVDSASREQKLALIRAHPQLASRARMADASVREQSGAGLDQCSPQEFADFQRLNAAYNDRFGFPFIVAVKDMSRRDILDAFADRLTHDPETEFIEALRQIHRIAAFRLADLFKDAS
jgi:2-oxo-4-hydroxy-4-carboxy-5-ureidoimidazoline decarboxylase